MAKIGLVTGSFDPGTNGHLDIIARASKLFDTLYVGILYNRNKSGLFTIAERKQMLEEAVEPYSNVSVVTAHDSLAVDVARELKAAYLVRGIRDAKDLEYEGGMDFFNHHLASDIESVYLLTSPEWQYVSSSRVRELIHFQADISAFVPDSVVKKVEEKYDNLKRI